MKYNAMKPINCGMQELARIEREQHEEQLKFSKADKIFSMLSFIVLAACLLLLTSHAGGGQ